MRRKKFKLKWILILLEQITRFYLYVMLKHFFFPFLQVLKLSWPVMMAPFEMFSLWRKLPTILPRWSVQVLVTVLYVLQIVNVEHWCAKCKDILVWHCKFFFFFFNNGFSVSEISQILVICEYILQTKFIKMLLLILYFGFKSAFYLWFYISDVRISLKVFHMQVHFPICTKRIKENKLSNFNH